MLTGAQLLVGLGDALAGDAGGLEDRARLVLAVRERAEQVLGGHVGVAHLGRELLRGVAHAHEVLADAHLGRVAAHARLADDGLVHLCLDGGGVRVKEDLVVGLQHGLHLVPGEAGQVALGDGRLGDGSVGGDAVLGHQLRGVV